MLSANGNDQGSSSHHPANLVSVLVGTGVGVVVVAMALVAVSMGIARYRRKKRRNGCGQHRGPPSEKMLLRYDFKS